MNDGTLSQDTFIALMEAQPKTKVFRLRDKKDLMGLNRGRKVAAFPVPSDYIVARQGELFFAEVKSIEDKDRFDYSNIQPGQRSAASMSAACGSPYWFFIHSLRLNKWFQLSGAEFYADVKAGKKSRRLDDLTPCTFF